MPVTTDLKEVSLTEMNALGERMSELKALKARADDEASRVSAELEGIKKQIIDYMLGHDLKSYRSPHGLLTVRSKFTAKLPQGENKIALFQFLKDEGEFERLASIHSATFNSWVQERYDLAKEAGEDEPQLPGVTEVGIFPTLSFTGAK